MEKVSRKNQMISSLPAEGEFSRDERRITSKAIEDVEELGHSRTKD